jgi:hypothetical protein
MAMAVGDARDFDGTPGDFTTEAAEISQNRHR